MTPDKLREKGNRWRELGQYDLANIYNQHAAALEEVSRIERLVYVPGAWKCAKCNLRLITTTLDAGSGRMAADCSPQECANGCGPMWRVTERDAGNDLVDRLDRAEAALADHERWLDEMVADYRLSADPNTGSKRVAINGLIHEQGAALAESERRAERLKDYAEVAMSWIEDKHPDEAKQYLPDFVDAYRADKGG